MASSSLRRSGAHGPDWDGWTVVDVDDSLDSPGPTPRPTEATSNPSPSPIATPRVEAGHPGPGPGVTSSVEATVRARATRVPATPVVVLAPPPRPTAPTPAAPVADGGRGMVLRVAASHRSRSRSNGAEISHQAHESFVGEKALVKLYRYDILGWLCFDSVSLHS